MKKKLTLYTATDVKKSLSQSVFVTAYDEFGRAESVAASEGEGVFCYRLNVATLRTLDLTEKDVPVSTVIAYALGRKKFSFSSREEQLAFLRATRAETIDDYYYDVIKTYSFDGFCCELCKKYLRGELDEETLLKVVFRKENVEYLIKSERAKKRCKAEGAFVPSVTAYVSEMKREEKMKKAFARETKKTEGEN